MSEPPVQSAEPEDRLGMTDEQWAWFQAYTHGFGEQDENGVDVSLLRENLRLTPTERIEKMLRVLPLRPGCCVEPTAHGLRRLLAALDTHCVRYVLTGGFAMTCHGSAYLTDDIDLACACDPANLAALAEALAPLQPRLRGPAEAMPFVPGILAIRSNANLAIVTDVGDVHLIADVPSPDPFEALWERSTKMQLFGVPVRVASLDDLIPMKRAAGRTKDQLHLLELERLRALVASGQMNYG